MALLPLLRLMRPANVVTAAADVLLGAAAAGALIEGRPGWAFTIGQDGGLPWLILGSCALYAGGVVMNDVFDAELDRTERPERPIPSGAVSERQATVLGCLLLILGLAASAQAGPRSAAVAALVAALAIVYDGFAKHHALWGPLCMGSCRGANLLLGWSLLPLTGAAWGLALLPMLYIAAITLISRGEVEGGSRSSLYLALAVFAGVVMTMLAMLIGSGHSILLGLPFILLFARMVFPPLLRATETPAGPAIGQAVRAAVLALIVFDAALAAALAGWSSGLLILALLPLSLLMASFFAVT